jgi:hypothetical protein
VICVLYSTFSYAEVLDRVVAVVNDEAIMLSEFIKARDEAKSLGINVTDQEVLEGLINRMLIVREAKKILLFSRNLDDEDEIVLEYIDKKIKAFIRVPFEEIEAFYVKNKDSFKGKSLYDVRDEIERYLLEKETNRQLVNQIKELRKEAYIKIQLYQDNI